MQLRDGSSFECSIKSYILWFIDDKIRENYECHFGSTSNSCRFDDERNLSMSSCKRKTHHHGDKLPPPSDYSCCEKLGGGGAISSQKKAMALVSRPTPKYLAHHMPFLNSHTMYTFEIYSYQMPTHFTFPLVETPDMVSFGASLRATNHSYSLGDIGRESTCFLVTWIAYQSKPCYKNSLLFSFFKFAHGITLFCLFMGPTMTWMMAVGYWPMTGANFSYQPSKDLFEVYLSLIML